MLEDDDNYVLHLIVDQFALPTFSADGMESWGLIGYHEWILLVDVMKDGDIAKTRAASTIAHELAHTVSHSHQNCNIRTMQNYVYSRCTIEACVLI